MNKLLKLYLAFEEEDEEKEEEGGCVGGWVGGRTAVASEDLPVVCVDEGTEGEAFEEEEETVVGG